MLFDAVLVGVILALLTGGRFSRLADLDLRWPWVFVAAFAVRLGISILGVMSWQPALVAAPPLHLLSYAMLLAATVANRHLWPMWIAAGGVLANLAVIAANGGAMPAAENLVRASGQLRLLALVEAGRFPTHTLIGAHTRLPFLADCLFLPPPYPRPCVFSPGDILITIGVVALILRGMGALGLHRGKRATRGQDT